MHKKVAVFVITTLKKNPDWFL